MYDFFHLLSACPIFLIPYIENKSGVAGIKKASHDVIIALFNNPKLGETSTKI